VQFSPQGCDREQVKAGHAIVGTDFGDHVTAPEESQFSSTVERGWLTWNSWIELAGRFCVVVPTVSSEISMPSTSMRAVRPKRPPNEMRRNRLGGIKVAAVLICTPGQAGRDQELRPLWEIFNCCAFSKHLAQLPALCSRYAEPVTRTTSAD